MHAKIILVFLAVVFTSTSFLYGQSFGFGCLGLVGGFGGYSFQRYEPTGFNDYISSFNDSRSDSLTSPMDRFGTARGFRVGINFFRADFQGFILTTKGFYQTLLEKHAAEVLGSDGISNYNYEIKFNYWGVGMDLGTAITRAFSWKVIDATILFNNVRFTDNQNYPGGYSQVKEYRNESALGYTIGTGFILSVIEGYISIEGLAGYTQMVIKSMRLDDGTELTIRENSSEPMVNFIDNGGFIAVIQLNIGFPL
jgi:hypothetical protein